MSEALKGRKMTARGKAAQQPPPRVTIPKKRNQNLRQWFLKSSKSRSAEHPLGMSFPGSELHLIFGAFLQIFRSFS